MKNKHWKTNNGEDPNGGEDPAKIITIEKQSPSDTYPQGNRIYFYSDVLRDSILNLNRQIDELTKQLKVIQFTYDLKEPPRIELHICSEGGDIFPAMSSVDKIINNPIPIDTYCEGIVASAATLLSCIGSKRYITPSSCMLIHQVSSGLWGNYMQFKDEIKNLELLMELIKGVYSKKTKFNNAELEDLLNHDLCLNSKKCLDYGLVDKIL
jgi:ATP-dependent protease ClpP protease subunit